MRRIVDELANGSPQVVLKSANKDDSNLAREIHHHRQFLHPHIARLYEVIVTESLVWLVLEYCPGVLPQVRTMTTSLINWQGTNYTIISLKMVPYRLKKSRKSSPN